MVELLVLHPKHVLLLHGKHMQLVLKMHYS